MPDVTDALRAEQDRLASMVESLDTRELAQPTRCEGWTIADVLLHLAQTNEFAVASTTGNLADSVAAESDIGDVGDVGGVLDVDVWAGAVVDAERSQDLTSMRRRWVTSAQDQLDAFSECDPRARVQWVAGEMAARTLATTRLSETWIHAGDIAAGLGTELPATDRLWHIARLAHRTLPHAFSRQHLQLSGPVLFQLRSPTAEQWRFGDDDAPTVIHGDAGELCAVAAQRLHADESALRAEGPDAIHVLELVRTFA